MPTQTVERQLTLPLIDCPGLQPWPEYFYSETVCECGETHAIGVRCSAFHCDGGGYDGWSHWVTPDDAEYAELQGQPCIGCKRCVNHCNCFICPQCDLRDPEAASCEGCERCYDCCDCISCEACGERQPNDQFARWCQDCEFCGDCCECQQEFEVDYDEATDPVVLDSFRTSPSRTLSSNPHAIDAFARAEYDAQSRLDLPFLGAGASKAVYDLGDGYVLKVNTDWAPQVKAECEAWDRADAETRKYLAPIIAHSPDYKWSIQPKAERVGHCSWYELDPISDACAKLGLRDITPPNVGWLNNQWVAIDYGCLNSF